jgi:hypothetical protein
MERGRMKQEELNEHIRLHKLWLEEKPEGKRANLSRANLYGANLSKTILEGKAFLSFQYQKHSGYYFGLNEITIGCHKFTIEKWLAEYKELGKKEGYTDEQIKQYGRFIPACAKFYKEPLREGSGE